MIPDKKNRDMFNVHNLKKRPFVPLLISGVLMWLVSIPVVIALYGNPGSSNEFGDMFGAVNSLFSGLALGGIIYAIIIQRHELILTREELARTAKAQVESARSLEKQLHLQMDSSRLAALTALLNSANEQINQNDRWNEKVNEARYSNIHVIEKRRACEHKIWLLLGKFDRETAA
ncbi:MAG TPA: hypothetical protein VL001_05415 [Candidimonas sp.]|nr:hypothetical protein [Candidimonas sp.]